MTGNNSPTRGTIGIIDRGLGDNSQAAITDIAPGVPVRGKMRETATQAA